MWGFLFFNYCFFAAVSNNSFEAGIEILVEICLSPSPRLIQFPEDTELGSTGCCPQ